MSVDKNQPRRLLWGGALVHVALVLLFLPQLFFEPLTWVYRL